MKKTPHKKLFEAIPNTSRIPTIKVLGWGKVLE